MVQDARPLHRRLPLAGVLRVPMAPRAVAWGQSHAAVLQLTAVAGLAAAVAGFLYAVALGRWANYQANAYDLGLFDQVVFNTSRGRPFETTLLPYTFAGEHTQPILLAFVPAYWLGAGPMFLVGAQIAVAALAAVPLYLFARRCGLAAGPALAAAAAYLANPYLYRALLFDFHPEAMAAFPMFVGAWAVVARRPFLAVGAALSLLLFKEDAVFMVLALAALMWVYGQPRPAVGVAVGSIAATFLTVFVVMPHYRGDEESLLTARYAYLIPWRDDSGLFLGMLFALPRALERLAQPHIVATAATFVAATALAGVARPSFLALLLPGLALALLSNHAPQRDLEMHYAVEVVPVALLAAVLGAHRLSRMASPQIAGGALLAPTLMAFVLLNPVGDVLGGPTPTAAHRQALAAALEIIPKDESVSVSAQSSVVPRLSQRRSIFEFPGAHDADWVIVDRYGARSSQSLSAGYDPRLQEVREKGELVYSRDGVEVFRNR